MNRTNVFTHLDANDKISGKASTNEMRREPYPVLVIGDLDIFPANVRQLDEIIAACKNAQIAMREAILQAWADAHPEDATPLGHGGNCLSCGRTVDQLFAARAGLYADGGDTVEVCGPCANVPAENVDELAEVLV